MNINTNTIQKLHTVSTFNEKKNRDNVSFGFSMPMVLAGMEKNPIIPLTLIDFFGMIVPRFIIDLFRNKDELGHYNWDAGRETFMRENIGTLIAFFAPGWIFTGLGRYFIDSKLNPLQVNTSGMTNFQMMNVMHEEAKTILSSKGSQTINVNEFRQELARNILNNVKGAYNPNTLVASSEGSGFIESIIKKVEAEFKAGNIDSVVESGNISRAKAAKGRANNVRDFIRGNQKAGIQGIKEIGEKALKEEELSVVLKTGSKVNNSVEKLVRDIFYYVDDVVTKAAHLGTNGTMADINPQELGNKMDDVLQAINKVKTTKIVFTFTSVLAMAFAYPKISNWITKKLNGGKEYFPGVAGLTENQTRQQDSHKLQALSTLNVSLKSSEKPVPFFYKSNVFANFESTIGVG